MGLNDTLKKFFDLFITTNECGVEKWLIEFFLKLGGNFS